MRQFLVCAGKFIGEIIDIFYPPFSRYFSRQFFRYGVSGAANVGFDWLLYFIVYNYILQKQFVPLGFVTISPHIARCSSPSPSPSSPGSCFRNMSPSPLPTCGAGAADPIHCGCRGQSPYQLFRTEATGGAVALLRHTLQDGGDGDLYHLQLFLPKDIHLQGEEKHIAHLSLMPQPTALVVAGSGLLSANKAFTALAT